MPETEAQLKRIQEKVQQILKQQTVLQKENAKLRQELEDSRGQNASHQKNMESLKQQVNVLKLNTADMSEVDKKEFEKRISVYLKEIDRCIALLGE